MDLQSVCAGICICIVALGVIWVCKKEVEDWLCYYIRKQIANSVDIWELSKLTADHSKRLKAIEDSLSEEE